MCRRLRSMMRKLPRKLRMPTRPLTSRCVRNLDACGCVFGSCFRSACTDGGTRIYTRSSRRRARRCSLRSSGARSWANCKLRTPIKSGRRWTRFGMCFVLSCSHELENVGLLSNSFGISNSDSCTTANVSMKRILQQLWTWRKTVSLCVPSRPIGDLTSVPFPRHDRCNGRTLVYLLHLLPDLPN